MSIRRLPRPCAQSLRSQASGCPYRRDPGVTFKWKDYRAKERVRHKTMTIDPDEFMRRFLLHVLPLGFHRIRYYGLIANTTRKDNLVRARELLIMETFLGGQLPRAPPRRISES